MIEVFKTNVQSEEDAQLILRDYSALFPGWKIGFDLDDCDKILRIDSGKDTILIPEIQNIIQKFGFTADLLQN
ncbi:MAG: hypothetical protein ACJ77K_11035 [Bacteroidia bacterium]